MTKNSPINYEEYPCIQVPRPEKLDSRYDALTVRERELGGEERAEISKIQHYSEELKKIRDGLPSWAGTPKPVSSLKESVRKLIGAEQSEKSEAADYEQLINQSNERIADIRTALSIIRAEKSELNGRVSRLAMERIAPQHRELVQELIDALLRAHRISIPLQRLATEMQSHGLDFGNIGVAFPTFLGFPSDSQSVLAVYFRRLRDYGFMKPEKVPAMYRTHGNVPDHATRLKIF